jgi:hypothetical protein
MRCTSRSSIEPFVDDRVRRDVDGGDENAHHVGLFEELTPQPARPREHQDDGDDAQDE